MIAFNWINLAQDRQKCLVVVNVLMSLRVAYNAASFLTEETLASCHRLCYVQLDV